MSDSQELVATDAPASYAPEEQPFQTVMVDLTHRCNMGCHNCYIPNREIPDMDAEWLYDMLARFPTRTRIRLVGAEPTMREDLEAIVARVRRLGHLPILMSNGLKLASRAYANRLKRAGLRTVYLSLNGGSNDDFYEQIDGLRCARSKQTAFDNLCAENFYLSLGMILVRGINETEFLPLYQKSMERRQVYELHVRSIGKMGRHMDSDSFTMEEMVTMCAEAIGLDRKPHLDACAGQTSYEFKTGRLKVQFTEWPDMGSSTRGRLGPDGRVYPFFEHMLANEGGY